MLRFESATSRLHLDEDGVSVGRMECLVESPQEMLIFHPRVEAGRDPLPVATALVAAAVERARGLGVAGLRLVLEERFPNADAWIAAAPSWGFELDVVKVLVRARLPELRLDAVPPAPRGAEFVSNDPETPDVFARVLASSMTASDRAADARAVIAENEALCRTRGAFHPEDWVLLRVDGVAAGVVFPAFAEADHQAATNLYVGVVPEARGRGFGALLVKHGIETMLRRGATRYIGSCNVANAAMLRVFERVGCSRVTTQHLFLRAGATLPP